MRAFALPLLFACACSTARTVPQPAAQATRGADAERRELERLNLSARVGGVTDTIAGEQVADPFRALEQDSELTRAWIAAQTERTERALRARRTPAQEQRLRQLLAIGSLEQVALAGPRTFLSRREGDREQPALYALEGAETSREPLVDPLQFGDRAALDWFYAAPDGRHIAFGISQNGSERSELLLIDVDRKQLLPERIPHAKWSSLTWLADGSGFYYTRYPREDEPNFDAAEPDTYFPRIFFHRLGSDPKSDPLVWQSAQGSDWPVPALGDDDRWLVVVNHRGFTASDVHLLDRGADPAKRVAAPDAQHAFTTVVVGLDKRTSGVMHRGRLYLLTEIGAQRRRVMAVAPERAGDMNAWREVIPEAAGTIEDFAPCGDRLAVHYVQDVHSRLALYDLDGKPSRELELPARGSIEALDADPRSGELALIWSSFFYPPALFRYAPQRDALEQVLQVSHDLDLRALTVSEAKVRSADGTEVNVQYVHRQPLVRNRDQPVLLYGYGGFDVSLLPHFTRSALYFLERGGIYAVANLRGGGEFGESWHRAGMLQNKPRVFEDFEAVMRWFADSGISRPQRIAITGGSNGGLLMGAMLTRVPERFAAAASYVGLYDMLRYHLFPPAQLWISEYGDPRTPEAARYLHGYSPYHRVVDGRSYPAALIETAEQDTRVFWGHSAKFAARLQGAQAGSAPIYFYMERAQGHGRGTRLDDQVQRYARMYAFLEEALAMP